MLVWGGDYGDVVVMVFEKMVISYFLEERVVNY
jgi:hypothetical protein